MITIATYILTFVAGIIAGKRIESYNKSSDLDMGPTMPPKDYKLDKGDE